MKIFIRTLFGGILLFLLYICSFQVYHEFYLKDVYIDKTYVVLDKNITGDEEDDNVYHLQLVDSNNIITDKEVSITLYHSVNTADVVELHVVDPQFAYWKIQTAYTLYTIGTGLLIVCLIAFLVG